MDDTTETVAAGLAEAASAVVGPGGDLTAAVAHANATAAPSDPQDALAQTFHRRLADVERVLGLVAPIVNAGETAVSALIPSAAPVLARVGDVERILSGVLQALDEHFGDKLPIRQIVADARAP